MKTFPGGFRVHNLGTVKGVTQVLRNMRRRDMAFARAVEMGLKRGGLYLQRLSQQNVPVDTGRLKASAFTRSEGQNFDTKVFVGYTESYALEVHMRVGMFLRGQPRDGIPKGQRGHHGFYWDPIPKARALFLTAPAEENKEEIGWIVRNSAAKYANWIA